MRESENVTPQKSSRIDLRTTQDNKKKLQEAAILSHKSITDFLLELGLRKAEQVLSDQRLYSLSASQWRDFNNALDKSPPQKKRLANLLQTKSIFEE